MEQIKLKQHILTAPGCQKLTQHCGGVSTSHWASHTQPRSWLQWCGHLLHWPQSWCRDSSTSASNWSLHPGLPSRHSRGQRYQRRTGTASLLESGSRQPPVGMPLVLLARQPTLCCSCLHLSMRGGHGVGWGVLKSRLQDRLGRGDRGAGLLAMPNTAAEPGCLLCTGKAADRYQRGRMVCSHVLAVAKCTQRKLCMLLWWPHRHKHNMQQLLDTTVWH